MRRYFQFGLRAFIVAVALVSIAVGWLAVRLREVERQRSAVTAVLAAGGSVEYDYELQVDELGKWIPVFERPGPVWLRNLLGVDFFTQAHTVTFFHQPELTDDQFVRIAALDELREVNVVEGRITEKSLDVIRTLAKLKRLRLIDVAVTDQGITKLTSLKNLESLDLSRTQITDRSLAHLSAFARLRILNLTGTQVTDEGMVHLTALEKLEVLNLAVSEVSDAGLPPLMQLKRLKHITLGGTRVTADGQRQLQQSLPDCQITWWPRRD